MVMAIKGPNFINFDAHIRTVKYYLNKQIKKWICEWATVLGGQNFKIDIKWEQDLQMRGYRLAIYVNNWVTEFIVDDSLFDFINKDVHYVEYIGEQALRCSQSGIITNWLEQLFEGTEDKYDLAKMWRNDFSKMVEEAHFQRVPKLGDRPEYYDLVHLILNDNPIPVTVTIKEVMDEPKLLLARLTMMKR